MFCMARSGLRCSFYQMQIDVFMHMDYIQFLILALIIVSVY